METGDCNRWPVPSKEEGGHEEDADELTDGNSRMEKHGQDSNKLKRNLLEMEGWRHFKGVAKHQKKFQQMVNQAKL